MLEAIKTAFSPQNDQKVLDPLKQLGNREIEVLKSKGYDLDFFKTSDATRWIKFR